VQAAPLPPRIIEKSLVSDRVVIDTVVSKICRSTVRCTGRARFLERDKWRGTEPPDAGWLGSCAWRIPGASRRGAAAGATPRSYLQADETPVGVQMHDGNGSNHLAYLWQYGRPHGRGGVRLPHGAWTRRPETFSREFRWSFAKRWICRLRFRGRAEDWLHACCWSHAKRKFVEAVKLHPQDAEAVWHCQAHR